MARDPLYSDIIVLIKAFTLQTKDQLDMLANMSDSEDQWDVRTYVIIHHHHPYLFCISTWGVYDTTIIGGCECTGVSLAESQREPMELVDPDHATGDHHPYQYWTHHGHIGRHHLLDACIGGM